MINEMKQTFTRDWSLKMYSTPESATSTSSRNDFSSCVVKPWLDEMIPVAESILKRPPSLPPVMENFKSAFVPIS